MTQRNSTREWLGANVGTPPSSSCRPRLYLYDLPKSYRHKGSPSGRGYGSVVHETPHHRLFLSASGTYGTGATIFERAMTTPCRVDDPAAADLFFVPVFVDNWNTYCAEWPCNSTSLVKRLRREVAPSGVSFLELNEGFDHFFVTPKSGRYYDLAVTRELHLEHPWWGGASRFAVEQNAKVRPDQFTQTKRIFRSVPWTSYVHMRRSTRWDDLPWRQLDRARPALVAAAFNPKNAEHKIGLPSDSRRLRLALNSTCSRRSAVCAFLPSGTRMPSKEPLAEPVRELAELYGRSVFCWQPMGDSVTRKAMIDAVLLGCINVFFHPLQQLHWPWHWSSWVKRASVFLDHAAIAAGRLDPIEELRRVPPEAIRAMQRTIAEHAHCLHYSDGTLTDGSGGTTPYERATLGAAPDAFDVLLRGAWEIATNHSEAWEVFDRGKNESYKLRVGRRMSRRELCEPVPFPYIG